EGRRGREADDRLQRLAVRIDFVVDEQLECLADAVDEIGQRPVRDDRLDRVADQVWQVIADVLRQREIERVDEIRVMRLELADVLEGAGLRGYQVRADHPKYELS